MSTEMALSLSPCSFVVCMLFPLSACFYSEVDVALCGESENPQVVASFNLPNLGFPRHPLMVVVVKQ